MRIDELISGLPIELRQGDTRSELSAIVDDSRQAMPECLFIARAGAAADGRHFIADAIARGAVAVLSDDEGEAPAGVCALVAQDVAEVGAHLAERFYGDPSARLKVIGITGTNGKTTTAFLVQQLLRGAGVKCGLMGTVLIDDGQTRAPAALTTPSAIDISRTLAAMLRNGCQACVMEVSSHALHQKRTAGINLHIGVFTNLTGDHLDYHGTMDAYRDAKAMLFERLPQGGVAIMNGDDPAGAFMTQRAGCLTLVCGLRSPDADCYASIYEQTLRGASCMFAGPWGAFECLLPLVGAHNVANALQAIAVGCVMGLSRGQLQRGIAGCTAPPGRLEPVTTAADEFAVLVDYAHTDDALESVLRTLRPIVDAGGGDGRPGRLRVVFGCGGDRDRTKRPRMAAVAARYADDIIITSDNPRTEDAQAIIDEIAVGIPIERVPQTSCIVDRAQAIEKAISRAQAGDIVLIAGKGHEDYQIIGTERRSFDDRLVAQAALQAQRRHQATMVDAVHEVGTP